MRFRIFALVSAALFTTPAAGEPRGYAYDPKTGTEFRWHMDALGNKHIVGFNRARRSMWNLTIDPAGNRSGKDEDGDYWTFDLESGVYRNSGQDLVCLLNADVPQCLEE